MNTTVVVLTLNEEKNIGALLAQLKNVSVDMCVVDGGSSDRTVEIARSFCKHFRTFVVVQGVKGIPEARNVGMLLARTEVVVLLEADVRLSAPLAEYVEAFERSKFVVAAPRYRALERNFYIVAVYWFYEVVIKYLRRPLYTGACLFIYKKWWVTVGGFKLEMFDDINFCTDVVAKGGTCGRLPQTVALSGRRFLQDGYWHTLAFYLRNLWASLRGGYVTKEVYKTGHFK